MESIDPGPVKIYLSFISSRTETINSMETLKGLRDSFEKRRNFK